jgi:murein DD-endopeptidase MepM/ murein hydrolase activator NlpD
MIALVVLAVPFAWSVAIAFLRRSAGMAETPDDMTEKRQLLILLAPALLGAVLLAVAPVLPAAVAVPVASPDDIGQVLAPPASMAGQAGRDLHTVPPLAPLHWLAIAVLTLCAGGAVTHALRLSVSLLRLHRVVAFATADTAWGENVRVTAQSIPPMAWGNATVLLPQTLLNFPPERIDMILRHEREHLRRGDTWHFVLLAAVDALFWFNPLIRAQTRRCRLAAELACDAAVTRSVPAARADYAELLVDALRHVAVKASPTPMPTVFPSEKFGDYQMRLNAILRPEAGQPKPKRRWQYALIAVVAVPVTFAQFAWSQTGATAPQPAAPAVPAIAATPPAKPDQASAATAPLPVIKPQSKGSWRPVPQKVSHHASSIVSANTVAFTFIPVAGERTTGFGVRIDPYTHQPHLHEGLDFYAAVGTAVLAAAPGTVSYAGVRDGYGEVVEIDHGNGMTTRYAHLNSAEVALGDHVYAGQEIAKSGSSGRSTGPHLHFEVWKNNLPIDPATVLPAA